MSIEQRPIPANLREIRPKIGKYEIKSMLGEGATGVVYEAYDPDIQRRVAIKTLHPHLLVGKVGAGLLARFKREAISAAKCIHPNIVTVLEYGQHGNRPFIVMEYVDGTSVHKFMKQRRHEGLGISLKRSLTIVSGLLSALHAAHWYGIVHRDVKASNILIAKGNNRIKLADFGMARIAESSDLTLIGSLIGTPRYMAPEVRFGLEADARADVFSAARLFLELLKMLPEGTSYPRSPLPELPGMPPGNRINYAMTYPSAFVPVLVKGLEPDRAKRFQTVAELKHAIRDALPGLRQRPVLSPQPRTASPGRRDVDDIVATAEEVDSMTELLAVFMGPIAWIVMEEYQTRDLPTDRLAFEVAAEIPGRQNQQEFLRRWQTMSITRQASLDEEEQSILSGKERPRSGDVLNKIGSKVAHYMEPISKTLTRRPPDRTKS